MFADTSKPTPSLQKALGAPSNPDVILTHMGTQVHIARRLYPYVRDTQGDWWVLHCEQWFGVSSNHPQLLAALEASSREAVLDMAKQVLAYGKIKLKG